MSILYKAMAILICLLPATESRLEISCFVWYCINNLMTHPEIKVWLDKDLSLKLYFQFLKNMHYSFIAVKFICKISWSGSYPITQDTFLDRKLFLKNNPYEH